MKMNFVVASLLALITSSQISAQTVSTTPPKDYLTEVAPLLTPLEKALEMAGEPPKEAEHGWVILDETVHHVRANGSRLIVEHQICRAISPNGAEGCGRDVTGYRLSTQKPHLVLAHSIQPDGRRQEVRPEARFLQTPQREADYDLYNDSGELVLIFPNVKPGTITESIVVLEESRQRIPGHYTSYFGFQFGWPAHLMRAIADMPGDYAARLTTTPLGRGVPEARKETLAKGRQRWTWEATRTRPTENEEARAPFDQVGPLVRLTTLKDWKEFVDWYRPLAEKQFVLGKKLESEVTRWTEKAASPQEILQILHSHVADDVRYVGLEFGTCDIEPHPASEVWEHQYGDCKDKASLLAAMLRFKGIPAHLVLVNTNHLGRVERRSPDYRDFSHAILLAELPEGPVFCDPTIEGSPPGLLSPSDADRDVLVISNPERWTRTPRQDAGTYALNFEAKLSATGELSGWATLETKGYFGNYFRNLQAKSTRQQLKERLQRDIGNTWNGASVIDLKTETNEQAKGGDPHRIQAYFIVPADGSPALRFPFNAGFLPDLGDGDKRETDAFTWMDTNSTTSIITLPPGFRAASVPSPLTVTHEHGQGSARWNLDGGKLRAVLSYQVKSSRLPAKDVKPFMQSVNTLRAWLDKPVTLEASEDGAPANAPQADPLADFPRMPTGEGQLDLVSERYPLNGDLKLRRAAYERAITFFPKDTRTQFFAKAQIAYVDQVEENHAASIRLLRGILEAQKGSVPLEDSALAEYLLALALQSTKENAAALALLDGIVANKQVSAFRRAWSHSVRSQLLDEKEPEKALQAAQEGLALESGDISALLQRVCLLRARLKQETGLRADLEKFIERETPQTEQQMTKLAQAVDSLAAEKPADALLLTRLLAELGQEARFGKDFDTALASARVRAETQGVFSSIQERLKQWVAEHPGDVPEWKVPDTLKTEEDFSNAIEKVLNKAERNPAELARLAVESLQRFEPGPWYGELLWRAVTYFEPLDRRQLKQEPPPLMLQLLELCDATPRLSEPHTEGRYQRALMLKRRGKLEEEAVILRGLVAEEGLDPGYLTAAIDRLADNAIARGKAAEAFEAWGGLVDHAEYYSVPTSLLKAVLLALETGAEETAFKFLKQLQRVEASVIAKSAAAENIQSFLKLAENEDALRAWWQHSAQWWPHWQKLEAQHLPKRDAGIPLVPVIPSLEQMTAAFREHSEAGRHDAALELLRTLGHAARWQPNMALEVVNMPNIGGASLARIIEPFREVIVTIHDTGGLTDPEQAETMLMWTMVALFDSGKVERAAAMGRDYHAKNGAKEMVGRAVARIWGMSAARSGKDMEEPTAVLETLLEPGTPDDNVRIHTVNALAGLYRKQNLRDKELALLKREIENPLNKDAEEALQSMRQRHDVLLDGGEAGDGPALTVNAWLTAHKPMWYDHVRPLDLNDEKAAEPDEAMAPGNDHSLDVPEAVKLCCLVALDPKQPDQRRFAAVGFLGWYSPVIATDMGQFKGWLAALKDEKSLPRPTRALAVWLAARRAFWDDMHAPLQLALAEPALEHLRDNLLPELNLIRRYARAEPHDLEATDALAAELLKGTVDYLVVECIERCIRRLAEGGRFEQARTHYKAMATARYDEDTAKEKGARQLAALKIINGMQKLHPVHEALKAWFLASPLAKTPEGMKPVPEPFHARWDLDLPETERLQLYRQWIQAGTWPRDNLGFWVHVGGAIPRDENQVPTALGMLKVALDKAPNDETRAQLVNAGPALVDTDDPPTLQALEKVLAPLRGQVAEAETQDALRLHDLQMKLRVGQEVDLFASLGTLRTPNRQARARSLILNTFVSRGDKAGARRMLDMIDPGQLLARGMIDDALHAYRLLGMTDEAELAADQMREFVKDELLTAWMAPHGDSATPVIHMALQLGESDLIPQAFSQHMSQVLRDTRERLFFESMNGLLTQDWQKTVTATTEAIRLYPTFYDFYNHQGIASAELGLKEEAVKAFTTFLKFDHNTIEAARAQQRLDKIQNAKQPPAGG